MQHLLSLFELRKELSLHEDAAEKMGGMGLLLISIVLGNEVQMKRQMV
ncbi:hypothetical protein [Acinetobacter tianfuensis]|nr:hypothetical protein [Acinetobacter tianfuensis]